MKKSVIAAACLLSGCAAQQMAHRQAVAAQGVAQCRAEIPSVMGNHVRLIQCFIDADTRAGFTGPLQQMLNATRLELAEKMDAGKMTQAAANAQFAQIKYQAIQEEEAERSQRSQAAAAILMGMPRAQPYQLPVYQTPQRSMTNCMSTGVGSGMISTSCY